MLPKWRRCTGISYNYELYRISSQARNKCFHSYPRGTERNPWYHFQLSGFWTVTLILNIWKRNWHGNFFAPDYPEIAKKALARMLSLTGEPVFDEKGMLQKGVIVRHLLLPGHKRNAREVIEYIHQNYGDRVILSLMNQYTPLRDWRKGKTAESSAGGWQRGSMRQS